MASRTPDPRNVVILIYDQLCTFEFGIATEIFARPRPEFSDWYRCSIVTMDPNPIQTQEGLQILAPDSLRKLDYAGTIVVPGWKQVGAQPPAAVAQKLRLAQQRGARLLSLCSGVFALAASGVLDGKRATTHWRYADALRTMHPSITVDPNVLYVEDDSILTSAGSAAGIDLCLHVVRKDFGTDIVNQVARRLVIPPHRDGGQAQFIPAPVSKRQEPSLAQLLDWLRAHLHQTHTVRSMARQAGFSPRTLARRFQESLGLSPHVWLTKERIRRAEELLENSAESMEQIAQTTGFGSAQLLRLHFRRIVGTTPTAYRKSFQAQLPESP